jgi:cysteinyl-tRNA synthetase
MIDLVGKLLGKGLAYRTDDGSVFFDISAFPGYGGLSKKKPGEHCIAGCNTAENIPATIPDSSCVVFHLNPRQGALRTL